MIASTTKRLESTTLDRLTRAEIWVPVLQHIVTYLTLPIACWAGLRDPALAHQAPLKASPAANHLCPALQDHRDHRVRLVLLLQPLPQKLRLFQLRPLRQKPLQMYLPSQAELSFKPRHPVLLYQQPHQSAPQPYRLHRRPQQPLSPSQQLQLLLQHRPLLQAPRNQRQQSLHLLHQAVLSPPLHLPKATVLTQVLQPVARSGIPCNRAISAISSTKNTISR